MAKKKTLSDLGALTSPEPEVPEVAETAEAPAEGADAEAAAPPAETAEEVAPPPPVQEEAPLREQQLDKHGRAAARTPLPACG